MFLPCSLGDNTEEQVSSGFDIEPTNAGDTKVIAPFGNQELHGFMFLVAPS